MSVAAYSHEELTRWRERVTYPPRTARLPLYVGREQVGSLDPVTWDGLKLGWSNAPAAQGVSLNDVLHIQQHQADVCLAVNAPFDANLHVLATALNDLGLAGKWRGERLAVRSARGNVLTAVERGSVRVLGISTQAVHLVGRAPDGQFWVQQRSWNKPNDPGLWDTLMGGTVAAGESERDTLVRETWEEAGLHLDDLHSLTHGGNFVASRHVPDGNGAGYLVEDTAWFEVVVPDGQLPRNQDGEVDHFELWSTDQVLAAMRSDRFTPEARWVMAMALGCCSRNLGQVVYRVSRPLHSCSYLCA